MKKIIVSIILIIIAVIGISIYFITNQSTSRETFQSRNDIIDNEEENEDIESESKMETMQISVSDGTNTIIYELNDSTTATELYNQLPLTTEVENFASNEKIFYPPNELGTENTNTANSGKKGVLAYYAPWRDVVMFYDSFSSASGLYELGIAIEGSNQIRNLTGKITIEKAENK